MQPYTGPSIVDYLSSVGKPTDFATRSNLASQNGIGNYTGTAQQNTQLLSTLRGASGSTVGVSRNDTNYAAANPGSTGTLRAQLPGETAQQYADFIKASPFLIEDANSGSGYRAPSQEDYNNFAQTYKPPSDQDLLASLIKNTSPSAQIKTANVSPGTPGVGGIDGMLAYYKSLFDTNTKQAADLQTQIKDAKDTQATQTQPFLSKLLSSQTPDQVRQNATAQTGINPTEYFAKEQAQIADIEATTNQYNQAVAARDGQIAQTNDKLASLNFINNQTAQINRNAAPVLNQLSATINAKAAALQASQGMFSEAQTFIHQAVDAATADLKYTFDMYNEFYNQNQDVINNLDTKYQNALTTARSTAEKAFTFAQDQATKVGNLLIDNPQAGISMTDTLDQALEKVQRTPKTTGSTVGSAETGYQNIVRDSQGNVVKTQGITGGTAQPGAVKITSSQLNSGSSLLGITPADYQKLDPQVQTFFVNTGGKTFMKALSDIKSGSATYDDVKGAIDSSLQPQAVKDYMQGVLDKSSPQKPQGPGFWSKLGSWITGKGFQ